MKITITTSYGKKLKYRIYRLDGKKRRLLARGRMLHSAEREIEPQKSDVVVRIQRRSLFISFFVAMYVGILNISYSDNRGALPFSTVSLYPFEEIRIKDITRSGNIGVRYEKSPLYKTRNTMTKNLYVDYLSCSTHPYEEYNGSKAVNTMLYAAAIIFCVAVVAGVCLAVRFLAM